MDWHYSSKWVLEELFSRMPDKKVISAWRTCYRNLCFTSEFVPEHCHLEVYKEGWYFVAEGCQCRFSVWAFDRDGEFEFGRKPDKRKLHLIWTDFGSSYDVPWYIVDNRYDDICNRRDAS